MDTLTKLIEAFLAKRRKSETEFTREDIPKLRQIIAKLCELKFQLDPDEKRPLEVILIDRTTGRMPAFKSVPHVDDEISYEIATYNLDLALDEMKMQIDLKRLREKKSG